MKKRMFRIMAGLMVAAMMVPATGNASVAFAGMTKATPSIIFNAPANGTKVNLKDRVFHNGAEPTENGDGSITFSGNQSQKAAFALPAEVAAGETIKLSVKLKFGSANDQAVRFYLINGGNDMNTAKEIVVIPNEGAGKEVVKTVSLTANAASTDLMFASASYGVTMENVTLCSVTYGEAAPKATATPVPTKAPVANPTKAPATPKATATPAPTKAPEFATVGDTLTVTERMVKSGAVTVNNAKYNKIVIASDVDAKAVNLSNVTVGELVVESGADYNVIITNGKVDALKVTAPSASGFSRASLLEMIKKNTKITEEVLLAYIANADKEAKIATLQPVVETLGKTTVGKVTVAANAKVVTNGCAVASVALNAASASDSMNVELDGYKGAVEVALNRADDTFCVAKLTLTDSKVTNVTVAGTDGSCQIAGNSKVDKVQVSGANAVTVAVDAKEIDVDRKTEKAQVRVYGNVDKLNAAGKENSIVIAGSATVKNAEVSGNAIKVYGYGKLEAGNVTGSDAVVAVAGATVDGNYDETVPAEMKKMSPTQAFKTNEKSEASKEPQEPTVTPGGSETPEAPADKTYTLSELKKGGYGYTEEGGVVTFNGQYQEIQYTLPETLLLGDYKSLTVNMENATGNVAIKLINADGTIKTWFGLNATVTLDLAELDQTASITKFAIMANDGECSVEPSTIVFVPNPDAASKEEVSADKDYTLSELKKGGYGYTEEGGVVTFNGQYQEIQYTLPETLLLGDYKSLTVNMENATGNVAIKIINADGTIKTWFGLNTTVTLDLAELDQAANITKFAIMANDGECSVEPSTITFTAK